MSTTHPLHIAISRKEVKPLQTSSEFTFRSNPICISTGVNDHIFRYLCRSVSLLSMTTSRIERTSQSSRPRRMAPFTSCLFLGYFALLGSIGIERGSSPISWFAGWASIFSLRREWKVEMGIATKVHGSLDECGGCGRKQWTWKVHKRLEWNRQYDRSTANAEHGCMVMSLQLHQVNQSLSLHLLFKCNFHPR
jgi:hypothetical protein